MRAVKFTVPISPGGSVQLRLPSDVVQGDAEVLVLVPDTAMPSGGNYLAISSFLDELADLPQRRSQEEIEIALEEERASWQ